MGPNRSQDSIILVNESLDLTLLSSLLGDEGCTRVPAGDADSGPDPHGQTIRLGDHESIQFANRARLWDYSGRPRKAQMDVAEVEAPGLPREFVTSSLFDRTLPK